MNTTASAVTGTYTGFGRRFAALIYDAFLLTALLMVYTGIVMIFIRHVILAENSGAWLYVYHAGNMLVIVAYYTLNWLRSGQTLGMRAWRLRTVSATGKPVELPAALLRCGFGALAWAPAALGVLWLYLDRDHLALHDRCSKTRVVKLSR